MVANFIGETGQQVAQNLLIPGHPDIIIWVGYGFFLPFDILGGNGLGEWLGRGLNETSGQSPFDCRECLGTP
jgi:hypothetical protein